MPSPSTHPLRLLLDTYREAAVTNRESGTYFEELSVRYFRNEPSYKELYATVETYADWAGRKGLSKRDDGIDLVAETHTGDVHAIQCKLYPASYRVQKSDIDSFFTASGKKPFASRTIICTTDNWSELAEQALVDQQIPINKIGLTALEDSAIDWSKYTPDTEVVLKAKKVLRKHQEDAVAAVTSGLKSYDRGKMIMACGTGKTFTSLKLAEKLAGAGKRVLFLVPSLALLSQTLREWTQESGVPIHCFAVCSDSDVGKRRKKNTDVVQTFVHELAYPATTDASRLAAEAGKAAGSRHMTVVFSTYHSIAVVHEAQQLGLPDFNLIICDEAHRTTGATFDDNDESAFVRVHDAAYVGGAKRLYMTATPRIFGNVAKATAEQDNVALCSMDDETLYGTNLYVLSFSEAVKRDLLVDYKVIVLSVEEAHVSRRIQNLLKDDNNEVRVDDAAKIIGCWKALSKQGLAEELTSDSHAMKRAVAFCQVIRDIPNAKKHRVASVNIANMFQEVVQAYKDSSPMSEEVSANLRCEAEHVDGSMNASTKESKIDWLKAETPDDTCRILSNVRCLSEGVDVPALDAVLFLTPRNSQVDVVQSVGRVMRKSPGKKRGYIVLPVVIPAGMEAHEALNDNRTYKVVWQVLQALRSHDDRFDAMVNKLDLNERDPSKMEVIAVTDKITRRSKTDKKKSAVNKARQGTTIGSAKKKTVSERQGELAFQIGEIERAIYAKLVDKVGNRHHWEDWANDIAQIANTHIDRLTGILENTDNVAEREAFVAFAHEMRDDLNDSISDEEIIEMLAQHMVTRPVFDALFSGHSFATQNSMSKSMQGVLDVLDTHRLDKESRTLEQFYDSVKLRAQGIQSAEGKQKIVVELYDKFFRNAFPRMSERLGIVYTPVEIVDFILHSVDHLLRTEFNQTLGSEGVHILDPFTGTGTFITRLMQSGLISADDLPRKYAKEIHANELVLLAYYIAAINIEATYNSIVGGEYRPFEGICLTDTFQMYESGDLISDLLADNSARRVRQKELDIRVIVGNPPYSVGQGSANDNNANIAYPSLDARIRDTYADRSTATNKNALYDSYIRAIRWASDRLGPSGIMAYVTNAGFLEGRSSDGMRRCLAEEFSSIHVIHLRGLRGQKTAGERAKREGGQVFGAASGAAVCIFVMIKNPNAKERGVIYFRDIGDYLTREEKLEGVRAFGSVRGIAAADGWARIEPDEHGDWLKQRDASFSEFIVTGDKKGDEATLFETFSRGPMTSRDAWAYNHSREAAGTNMSRMVAFYNAERERFHAAHPDKDRAGLQKELNSFVSTDSKSISWSRALRNDLVRNNPISFDEKCLVQSTYRPFDKEWMYFDRKLNDMVYQMPRIFPVSGEPNLAIMVKQRWYGTGQLALMVNSVTDLQSDGGAQIFPMYFFSDSPDDDRPNNESLLLSTNATSNGDSSKAAASQMPTRMDGITDEGLLHFQSFYSDDTPISKEDVFYYVYGILHSVEYRNRFKDNLGKELPRIPRVKSAPDFWHFSKAGRDLAVLHVAYEKVPEFRAKVEGPKRPTPEQLRVEKMKFGKGKDRSVIHYNAFFTIRDIPIEAYDYVVNGKSAIQWVMERQRVTTDKKSGIVKDANDWATETVGDPRYPLSLLLRVITVSLETVRIVDSLPALDLEGE